VLLILIGRIKLDFYNDARLGCDDDVRRSVNDASRVIAPPVCL